ncbi:MAG: glycosyltransferase family 2 protein [Pseudomonadota bacterium]
MPGRVTVIIAAYNAEAFIRRAIESALAQTCAPDVIIVDDASTDGTAAHVRELIAGVPQAKLIVQYKNQGPAAARNRAIAAAATEWVTPLDADDAMDNDRLKTLVDLAEQRGWDAVADDQYRVTSWEAGADRRRLWSDDDFGILELTLARFVRENIMAYTGFGRELGFIKPLMRRAFLVDHGLGYDRRMRLGEDYDLYCRLLARGGRFGLVDPRGYIAFETPGSLSKQHSSAVLRAFMQSDQRLLSSKAISDDARVFLKEHRTLLHKKWAWAHLSEAYRERNPMKALSSFIAPPEVLADLSGRLVEKTRARLSRA